MTRLSQSDEVWSFRKFSGNRFQVYNQDITNLSVTVAKEAVKHKIQKFVEVSSAEVYKPSNVRSAN